MGLMSHHKLYIVQHTVYSRYYEHQGTVEIRSRLKY